jgi:hypothetical protein
VSTKPGWQSTEGYAQGSRLSADRCASHERDGDAEQHVGLPRFRPPCGRNTLCHVLLLLLLSRTMHYKLDCPRVCFDVFEGGPLPSLYSSGGRVIDLETNLSRL